MDSSEFDATQWLINALALDLTNMDVFEQFLNNLLINADQFARMSKTDILDNFMQFDLQINLNIRAHLSSSFLEHNGISLTHIRK
jgi:hypothetical protein